MNEVFDRKSSKRGPLYIVVLPSRTIVVLLLKSYHFKLSNFKVSKVETFQKGCTISESYKTLHVYHPHGINSLKKNKLNEEWNYKNNVDWVRPKSHNVPHRLGLMERLISI